MSKFELGSLITEICLFSMCILLFADVYALKNENLVLQQDILETRQCLVELSQACVGLKLSIEVNRFNITEIQANNSAYLEFYKQVQADKAGTVVKELAE